MTYRSDFAVLGRIVEFQQLFHVSELDNGDASGGFRPFQGLRLAASREVHTSMLGDDLSRLRNLWLIGFGVGDLNFGDEICAWACLSVKQLNPGGAEDCAGETDYEELSVRCHYGLSFSDDE